MTKKSAIPEASQSPEMFCRIVIFDKATLSNQAFSFKILEVQDARDILKAFRKNRVRVIFCSVSMPIKLD